MSKASEQANLLWPYLLPKIERVAIGSGGSGATPGIGGAPSPHALSSAHHTGTISDAQAPQFLLVDGTRALTGNLSVNPGIVIDGVDLSAHVADPDAHHARVTVGNGLSLSGQLVAVDLATNPGLEFTGGKLRIDLVSNSGMQLDANGLGIDLVSNSGMQLDANGLGIDLVSNSGMQLDANGLGMGTPSTLTINSTNSITTSTHNHAISANSNVGLYGTVDEFILKSTPSGGLTLSNLDVTGGVDITDGGQLYVAGGLGGVGILNTAGATPDVARVGIGIAPDLQFMLDVGGAIRGTELVGKHAIQLDDLALLLHFDGGHPYETNYTGELNAIPMGQVPSVASNIIFRPGKFYKAAVFGGAGTNLVGNPSFETNLTNWYVYNGGGGTLGATRVSDDFYVGNWSAKLTWTALNNSQFYYDSTGSSAAATYSFGAWMRAAVPCTVTMLIQRSDAPYTTYGSVNCSVTEEWQYFSVSAAYPSAGIPMRIEFVPSGSANTVWVDAVQFEQAATPSWYIDGSLGTGYAWTGTAHASTSTRSATDLVYTLSNMVKHRWSVMGWFRWPCTTPPNNNGIFSIAMSGGSEVFEIYVQNPLGILSGANDGSGFVYNTVKAVPIVTGQWYHIAATYSTGELRLFVDGAFVESRAITYDFAPASIVLGLMNGGANNGHVMIDDLCVSRQKLSDNRIRAIHESDAPVFATSSVFSFRATPKGLVWADEEGLWMRNTAGGNVLGAYGGESTKSWGGITLSPSDLLIGDSNRGAFLLWDDSAGNLIIGKTGTSTSNLYLNGAEVRIRSNTTERFSLTSAGVMTIKDSGGAAVFTFDASAGAEFTKPLTLGTNGGIYQGSSGSFSSPGTGLKMWRDTNMGRIAGYNGGTLQWYGGTDGKLYAGAGNLFLDSNGLTIAAKSVSSIENFPSTNSVLWSSGGSVFAGISGQVSATTFDARIMTISSLSHVNDTTSIVLLQALDHTGGGSEARIWVMGGPGVPGGLIDIKASILTANRSSFSQSSTTGAVPTMILQQSDLSEEFIQFDATIGAGNPIDTAAVGTYYGKIRVSVNGTFKFIPLYNT